MPAAGINAAAGELLRELTLNPGKNHQPTGPPKTPHPEHHAHPANTETPNPNVGSGSFRCLERSHGGSTTELADQAGLAVWGMGIPGLLRRGPGYLLAGLGFWMAARVRASSSRTSW